MKKEDVVRILKNGGIGVCPTDTLYGLVASAFNKRSVERLYRLKGRDENKPFIILIDKKERVHDFSVMVRNEARELMETYWPGPLTIILPRDTVLGDLDYLDRGTKSLAFRVPSHDAIRDLVACTGSLVAPSANPQGEKPAVTIHEARTYFGASVDFYIEGGVLAGEPSTIVDCTKEPYSVVRQGAVIL